jgi:Tfp pilus assembly protein PilO
MKNKRRMVLVVIVIVVGVVLALFGYWFYVPSLEEPLLSASAKEETIQIGQLKRTYLSYVPKAIDSHAHHTL